MKNMLLVSTFEVFESKLDALFGGELSSKKIVCIPTAAYGEQGYETWLPPEKAPIQKRAGNFIEFDIAGKTFEEVDKAIQDADIIYVTGGNTYYLLEQARACDLKKCIQKCFERGGLYFGSSAGAIITSPRIDFIEDMDNNNSKLDAFKGLNFTDFLLIPHLDHKHYGPIISNILKKLKSGSENIIGLKDNQGLYIEDSYIQVI